MNRAMRAFSIGLAFCLTIIVLANRTDIDPDALALKVADLYLAK